MNNNYYQNPIFPENNLNNITHTYEQQKRNDYNNYNNIMEEQFYIENILKSNKGKLAKVHITIPGSIEWQDKTFEGIIEQIGRDYLIISNPNTLENELIPMIYIVYITFPETINYK